MIFRDEQDKSFPQKCLIFICFFVTLLISIFLTFIDVETIVPSLKHYQITGNAIRQVILYSCLIIYIIRVVIMGLVFLRRKLVWRESITIAIGMSIIIFFYAFVGGNSTESLNIFDFLGMILFVIGSYLNSYSEYQRHLWKIDPQNKGRLYTEGLFGHSMHINYFGDSILFTGLAIITQSPIMLLIPLGMTMNFVFILIPTMDEYLESKYGEEFRNYTQRTKKFIPLIY